MLRKAGWWHGWWLQERRELLWGWNCLHLDILVITSVKTPLSLYAIRTWGYTYMKVGMITVPPDLQLALGFAIIPLKVTFALSRFWTTMTLPTLHSLVPSERIFSLAQPWWLGVKAQWPGAQLCPTFFWNLLRWISCSPWSQLIRFQKVMDQPRMCESEAHGSHLLAVCDSSLENRIFSVSVGLMSYVWTLYLFSKYYLICFDFCY